MGGIALVPGTLLGNTLGDGTGWLANPTVDETTVRVRWV